MSRARVLATSLLTAAAVAIAGGGEAFWLCVPAALAAAGLARTRVGALIATAVVVVAAAIPEAVASSLKPLPPLAFAVIVPAASAIVLRTVQERLERQRDAMHSSAHTDPLTGAENRRSLIERIEYEIARHARDRRRFTVVMLDVDGFKLLNDRFGHAAGDELLCDLATAIKRSIRAQDTVARIGGDEFCVLAPETDRPGERALLARIHQAVSGVTAGVHGLAASVGTAQFPADGRAAAALLDSADQRLLDAKRELRRAGARRRAA
jgi:diguanylate cyclase (GGDEF)-like protein